MNYKPQLEQYHNRENYYKNMVVVNVPIRFYYFSPLHSSLLVFFISCKEDCFNQSCDKNEFRVKHIPITLIYSIKKVISNVSFQTNTNRCNYHNIHNYQISRDYFCSVNRGCTVYTVGGSADQRGWYTHRVIREMA